MSMQGVLDQAHGEKWSLYQGDCCEIMPQLPAASVGYAIFSPPFASLYTYSNSPRDLGNVKDHAEFFAHFDFVIAELRRIIMPGRVVSFHCMAMPTSKERDGYTGQRDFPGDLLRAFERHGFIYHSDVVIWKDPVTAMQRTKAVGLLQKTVANNSAMCRQGIPDRLITMRAPGESPRIEHSTDAYNKPGKELYSVDEWQKIASPVWMDINPSDTLQYRSAREHDDERHICPLQLEVIRRGIKLWSAPDDVVFTPFAGIGSEVYVALEMGRKGIGIELKRSYYEQAVGNMNRVAMSRGLFF